MSDITVIIEQPPPIVVQVEVAAELTVQVGPTILQGGASSGLPALAADVIGLGANMPRAAASNGSVFLTSGQVTFQYLTAADAGTVARALLVSGSTAAAGLTLAKTALFTVAANGDLTRVAISADALTVPTNSIINPAFLAGVAVARGDRLAVAYLAIGTTPPALRGAAFAGFGMLSTEPTLCRQLPAQTDIPAFVAAGALSIQSIGVPYAAIVT